MTRGNHRLFAERPSAQELIQQPRGSPPHGLSLSANVITVTDRDGEADERMPEFAEKANFMLSEGEQAYRQAVRYLRSMRGREAPADEIASVVSRLTAALDPPHTETIVRLLDLLNVRARSSMADPAGASLTPAAVLSANADVVGAIDDLTLTKSEAQHVEDMDELITKAARSGFLDLSAPQVLAVVLIVLLAVGVPFAQVQLPPDVQSFLADEEADSRHRTRYNARDYAEPQEVASLYPENLPAQRPTLSMGMIYVARDWLAIRRTTPRPNGLRAWAQICLSLKQAFLFGVPGELGVPPGHPGHSRLWQPPRDPRRAAVGLRDGVLRVTTHAGGRDDLTRHRRSIAGRRTGRWRAEMRATGHRVQLHGGIRLPRKTLRIVPAPIQCPRRRNSPWIRRRPGPGFRWRDGRSARPVRRRAAVVQVTATGWMTQPARPEPPQRAERHWQRE